MHTTTLAAEHRAPITTLCLARHRVTTTRPCMRLTFRKLEIDAALQVQYLPDQVDRSAEIRVNSLKND